MTDTGVRQRLAAILAADVAGYSRLMAADERATVAALDAARSVFNPHFRFERWTDQAIIAQHPQETRLSGVPR